MTRTEQGRLDAGQHTEALRIKRPITERKLQANRANAKRSTGPRTERGKAIARRNALKHGILSRSLEPSQAPATDFSGPARLLASTIQGAYSAPQQISALWEKLVRVLILEKDCIQRPGGLERYGRLIQRYERMLTRQLHARILEQGCPESLDVKVRRNL